MGVNTMNGKESQDKKYDGKKTTTSAIEKVQNDSKNKVRDIHNKK